jgi:hypothetical protein
VAKVDKIEVKIIKNLKEEVTSEGETVIVHTRIMQQGGVSRVARVVCVENPDGSGTFIGEAPF